MMFLKNFSQDQTIMIKVYKLKDKYMKQEIHITQGKLAITNMRVLWRALTCPKINLCECIPSIHHSLVVVNCLQYYHYYFTVNRMKYATEVFRGLYRNLTI